MVHRLSHDLGLPVIEGIGMAIRFVSSLTGLELSTSKTGGYAFPLRKEQTQFTLNN